MDHILKVVSGCPVLMYQHFLSEPEENMAYRTTSDAFEKNIIDLLKNGYVSISLAELQQIKNSTMEMPGSPFCLIMVGGYESNYLIAYEILKKYNIKADIFIINGFVGSNFHPRYGEIIPHFSWEQAREMVSGGLVKIHPFWHQLDDDKGDIRAVVKEKTNLIKSNVGEDNAFAFYYPAPDTQIINLIQGCGIDLQIIDIMTLNPENIEKGCIGRICVQYETDILNDIDLFKGLSARNISKQASENTVIETAPIYKRFLESKPATVRLPVNKKPVFKNYLRSAMPLSVLFSDREDKYNTFLINQYIDLIAIPYNNTLDHNVYLYYQWDHFDFYRIHREHIEENGINVLGYIYNGLRKGYYSDISLDAYYIPGKSMYNRQHFTHQLLIYGYDEEKDLFHAMTYTDAGQYEDLDVQSDDLIRACSTNHFVHINLFKRELTAREIYNGRKMRDKLFCYLNSINYDFDDMKYNKDIFDECQFGFNACKWFRNYIVEACEHKEPILSTTASTFTEHKSFMGIRIKYIADKEKIIIYNVDEIQNTFKKYSEMILNLVVKYNMTKASSVADKILKYIDLLIDMESETLSYLLQALDKKYAANSFVKR